MTAPHTGLAVDAGPMLAVFTASRHLRTASPALVLLAGAGALAAGTTADSCLRAVQAAQPNLAMTELSLDDGGVALLFAPPMPDAKSRFLATMSHELRTPLNVVIGFADTLARDAALPAAQITEFATAIRDAGQDLLGLINTMLDVARIEQGRFELQADTIDIAHLVNTCVTAAQEQARKARVQVTGGSDAGPYLLRADERRLRQVLGQLIANALTFTAPGGRVTVSAAITQAGRLCLSVDDNGAGIPADQIAHVFEPFNQADGGLARRTPGMGLGLYVARALAVAHGGSLTLESDPGVLTIARLTLPRARLIAPTASAALSQESP